MKTDISGKELANQLAKLANVADRKELQEFVKFIVYEEHPTLQQDIFRWVVWPLIKEWATKNPEHDGRSEATVNECKRLVAAVEAHWHSTTPPIPRI
jgi:hypothetical protein